MTVKIVTDSTADLPPDLMQELGITVVPALREKVFNLRQEIKEGEKPKKHISLPSLHHPKLNSVYL